MFAKLLTALVLAVLIGTAIFNLRQQRLELMHEITVLHRQMNRDRQATWDAQVRIASQTSPKVLQEALARAGLTMEPALTQHEPGPASAEPYVDASYER